MSRSSVTRNNCPDVFDVLVDDEPTDDIVSGDQCIYCSDRGCEICLVQDPETGGFISVDKVFKDERSWLDDLCLECHDPDCPSCS